MTISSTSSSRAHATIASPGPAMPEARSKYSARVSCSSSRVEKTAEIVPRGVAGDLERAGLAAGALVLVRRQHLEHALRLERGVELLGVEHVQQEQLGAELPRERDAVLDRGARRLAEIRRYENAIQGEHGALVHCCASSYPTLGLAAVHGARGMCRARGELRCLR